VVLGLVLQQWGDSDFTNMLHIRHEGATSTIVKFAHSESIFFGGEGGFLDRCTYGVPKVLRGCDKSVATAPQHRHNTVTNNTVTRVCVQRFSEHVECPQG
jgi:hypothetical protein